MSANTALSWMLILPLAASPLIYLVGRLVGRASGRGPQANPARWLAFLALLATAVPLYYAGQAFLNQGPLTLAVNGISIRMDGIGLLVAVVVLALGLLVTLFSTTYMGADAGQEKFYALLTAMIGAMIGLGSAGDLFNLWVWFEAMSITSYMLVAFYRDQRAALEAGVKYVIQSAAGSALVLLGIALVFAQTGQLDLQAIHGHLQSPSPLVLAAGALFFIGFGVKTAIAPLHAWLPDAHSQAPSGISAMLSGVVIEAGMVALLRSLGALGVAAASWGNLLMIFGAVNILIGNLMALRQTEVKRLLAYSSVSQIGYMLIGLGVAISFNQPNGAGGGFFHLINHALMKGAAFLAAGALLYALHLGRGDHRPLLVTDLDGASRRYPVTAFALSVAVLGLGGLPPLAGFMSKWQIFVSGFQTQNAAAIVLMIFLALNSVLSLGYYAPLVNRMYRREPSPQVEAGVPVSAAMGLPLVVLTLATVIIGFWPTLLSWLTGPAAASLLRMFGGS